MVERYDEELTMRQARDLFLSRSGYELEEYDAPFVMFPFPLTDWKYPLPNPPARRWAVLRHDLHHIVASYDTDWPGEAEAGAWECGAGLGRRWLVWYICTTVFALGLVAFPRRTWRAFKRGRSCERTLLSEERPYEELLAMTVKEARAYVGLVD